MKHYTFTAFGHDINVTVPENDFGHVYEHSAAMAAANEKLHELPEFQRHPSGSWFQSGGCNFRWVEGNFFD